LVWNSRRLPEETLRRWTVIPGTQKEPTGLAPTNGLISLPMKVQQASTISNYGSIRSPPDLSLILGFRRKVKPVYLLVKAGVCRSLHLMGKERY
jgi:hypothetical protein